MMTKQDFGELFKAALELAALNAEERLGHAVPRNVKVVLHGAGYSGALMSPEEALDTIYLGEDLFYRIIDVAIIEVGQETAKVFLRVSQHDPGNFSQTWNTPPGSGPFKQLVADEITIAS
jgi:hypothetical protein